MLKDLKESLSNARKPDITHVRKHFLAYVARPAELGTDKYERANYLRATGDGPHTEPTAADFERLRAYARAAVSHIGEMLQAMEVHQANDPQLVDIEGMKSAAYAIDLDVTPGGKVGASKLPHIAPACTSLMMAIEQAVACGLLPADPGTPWKSNQPQPPVKVYRTSGTELRDELIADGFEPNSSAVALAQAAFAPSKPGTLHTPLTEANYTSYVRVSVARPPTYQPGGDPGDEQPGKGPWAVENEIRIPAGSGVTPTVDFHLQDVHDSAHGARWQRRTGEDDKSLAARIAREAGQQVDALALSMREINERATATMPSDCVGSKIMERVWRFDTSDVLPVPVSASGEASLAKFLYHNPEPLPRELATRLKGKTTAGELVVRLHTDPIAADFVPHDVDLTRDQVEALPDGTPIRVMWLGTEKWQSEAYGAPLVKGTSNVGVVCARAQHADRFELVGTLATINPEGLRVRLADQKAQGV